MISLVLITGFLGSGKTTLLEHLARRCQGRQIVWLVNEFSAQDMDSARLAGKARDVVTVAGGSIFCRCKVTEFLEQLGGFPQRFNPEAVVVEASGMADPVVAGRLLQESGLDRRYRISAVVAVVDPGSFLKLLQTLPNIRAQIEAATVVLINKTDLHPAERLEQTESAVRELNPSVPIIRTQHSAAELDLFGTSPRVGGRGEVAPCVDPHFAKFEITPAAELDLDWLRRAVEKARDEIYRIKGVVLAGGRRVRLDYSASGWHIEETGENQPPALVLIARGACSEEVRKLMRGLGR